MGENTREKGKGGKKENKRKRERSTRASRAGPGENEAYDAKKKEGERRRK